MRSFSLVRNGGLLLLYSIYISKFHYYYNTTFAALLAFSMGIRGLWQAVAPARQSRTLTELAVREGFEPTRRADRCLRVGIDSSIWMNQAQTAISYRHGPGTLNGENPALRILFFRLCRLLALPIIPIFVFDGPERPSIKRGVQVKSRTEHGLTTGFKAFIEAFGFYWYQAPGEAEADLAELNKRDFVDAVFSEDSDILVYGARTVIRMENSRESGDLVTIYDSRKIAIEPRIKLTHEGLFFMAILCGGDYNKEGLPGCGSKTALLLSQTSLGDSLYVAASTSSTHAQLRDFLQGWRKEFVNLLTTDPNNFLGKKYPSLAREVDCGFPSVDVLLLYAQPVTSWASDQTVPNTSTWTLSEPNLPKIATLSEKYFSWGSDKTLISRFASNLWAGIAIRFFLSLPSVYNQLVAYCWNDSAPGGSFTNANVLRIRQEKIGPGGPSTHSNVLGYTIEISTTTLHWAISADLENNVQTSIAESNETKALIWIPASILSAVLPAMVQSFRSRRKLPNHPLVKVYCPVLPHPQIPNLQQLIPLESERQSLDSPLATGSLSQGPSIALNAAVSSGNSISNPIILSHSDSGDSTSDMAGNAGRTSATASKQRQENSSLPLSDGRAFLGFIDLC